LPIVIINTAHVVSMDNYTPCGTSAAGSLLLVMVGNGRWCVGGVGGDFSHTGVSVTGSEYTMFQQLSKIIWGD